ncbi:MAG: hypothetical protein AM326_01530 [Candidatus Thorarchaeota archaeon SMTZ-45]|nr:MAG: hypothetical protein AM326_01530 [Candidatus Thorarchaeota archaeon SMTZ-45]
MPKSDIQYLVKQSLESSGKRMLELADQIGDTGAHFSKADRKMIRMAMIPALEDTFSEFVHFFLLENDEATSEAFQTLDRIVGIRF